MSLRTATAQIITESQAGSEFAHYATQDLQMVLGGFSDEYDGHASKGGRDIFLVDRVSGDTDIWCGPGVEQFIPVKSVDGESPLLLVRYFGSLENRQGQVVQTNVSNAYVITDIRKELPFLFHLELSLGQVQCAEQAGDSLWVLVKSEGSILINDSLIRESASEELVLLLMERNSSISAEPIFTSSGEYQIADMQKTKDGLHMVGSFLGQVHIGQETIAPPTSYYDGLFLHWDQGSQEIEHLVIASGVFDVRLTHLVLEENDTLLLGEYFGNVMLEGELLEDVRLNNSLFLYSYRKKSLFHIGGEKDEQAINMHPLRNGGIMITGNHLGRFEFGELMADCRGDACGFFLHLDESLGIADFQRFYSSERTDIFNSYLFQQGLFCGSYRGNYRETNPISIGEDWFCERIALSTTVAESEKEKQLLLYPNPTGMEAIRIDVPWPESHFQLFDVRGRLLRKGTWAGQLSVLGLSRGIHFLRVYDENASKMFTFNKVN